MKKTNAPNKKPMLVIWLIGVVFLIYNSKIIIMAATIWGLLGVIMAWSIFCINAR